MAAFLKKKAWSPYTAGIVIGLLQIPAFLIIGSALGLSSSFVSMSGYLASFFDSTVRQIPYFEKYMTSLKYAWQASMILGIVLGALISRRLSGAKREPFSPIWRRTLGITSLYQRLSLGFIGGAVLLFGARWAGG